MLIAGDVPVQLGRAAAREAAQAELARAAYREARPSLTERVVGYLYDRLAQLLDRLAEVSPGGHVGLLAVVLLVVAAVVAVRLRVGPLGRAAGTERALFVGGPRSADEHRAAAEAHAASGEWALAVRERLRAVVRSLEERALLEPRPGRTADEAAREAGVALPECAEVLLAAARLFDEVWYGGRPAGPDADRLLRELDRRVAAARPLSRAQP